MQALFWMNVHDLQFRLCKAYGQPALRAGVDFQLYFLY